MNVDTEIKAPVAATWETQDGFGVRRTVSLKTDGQGDVTVTRDRVVASENPAEAGRVSTSIRIAGGTPSRMTSRTMLS